MEPSIRQAKKKKKDAEGVQKGLGIDGTDTFL